MILQFCGLSGSGKTTLAQHAKAYFKSVGVSIEVIDGDEYRKCLCADLGFTKEDRNTNIRRLAFVASRFAQYQILPVICAINPYDDIRREVTLMYPDVKTIYIKCSLEALIRRDPKGLYARSFLPDGDLKKIYNLTGVTDVFEEPVNPELVIETDKETIDTSQEKLITFIKAQL